MKIALALLLATSASAADWTLIRRISQAAGCAASMVDTATTLRPGLVETNALLGSGRPHAGRIISLKLGVCAGQIAYAEYMHHRHPEAKAGEKISAIGGIGAAGFFGALAFHNERIKVIK